MPVYGYCASRPQHRWYGIFGISIGLSLLNGSEKSWSENLQAFDPHPCPGGREFAPCLFGEFEPEVASLSHRIQVSLKVNSSLWQVSGSEEKVYKVNILKFGQFV